MFFFNSRPVRPVRPVRRVLQPSGSGERSVPALPTFRLHFITARQASRDSTVLQSRSGARRNAAPDIPPPFHYGATSPASLHYAATSQAGFYRIAADRARAKKRPPTANNRRSKIKFLASCYSPTLMCAVPSPLELLTTVFGKGTCVSSPL